MKYTKGQHRARAILQIVKESSKPVFRTLQRFFFGLLPNTRVYAPHSWRLVILSARQQPCDDADYTNWIAIAQALQLPVQVIQSNLKRKDDLVGYLEVWEKGILKRRRELILKKEVGISIQFSSQSISIQSELTRQVDLGSIVLP